MSDETKTTNETTTNDPPVQYATARVVLAERLRIVLAKEQGLSPDARSCLSEAAILLEIMCEEEAGKAAAQTQKNALLVSLLPIAAEYLANNVKVSTSAAPPSAPPPPGVPLV